MSFFSNNLVATVSQNAMAGQNMNARGTMSSATSGFKWNNNNRLLAPAFRGDNKENGANRSQDNIDEGQANRNPSGVVNINSLLLNARAENTFSEYGTRANVGAAANRPPLPLPSSGNYNVGMRSVGAGGFPRSRVTGTQVQANGVLSDVDVNSHISAPFYGANRHVASNDNLDGLQ